MDISRKDYFRNYYLNNKNKTNSKDIIKEVKTRGRPKNIIKPFLIIRKNITLHFE